MEHNPIQIPAPEALATVPTPIIAAAIDQLIEALDHRNGDSDSEPNGDELDGNASEDDFMDHTHWSGEAGCPVSDPAEDDDSPTDVAWIERADQTRRPLPRFRRETYETCVGAFGSQAIGNLEDAEDDDAAEDDDPGGGNVDDEPHDPDHDFGIEDEPHDQEEGI